MINIDWNGLKSDCSNLYCYAISLRDGEIIRSRAYFHSEKFVESHPVNEILDELVSSKLARCFSYGKDKSSDYIKYDLHVYPADCFKAYEKLEKINFFDLSKIKLYRLITQSNNFKFFNRTLGAKVSIENELQNICVYFSNNDKLALDCCKKYINELCVEFGLQNGFCIPYSAKDCWLYIVALDFSDTEFKLKFYIEFSKDFDNNQLLTSFENTKNYGRVKEIAESNGKILGYQIAVSDREGISYNFYLDQKK